MKIIENLPASDTDIHEFLPLASFVLPSGFVEFYLKSNSAVVDTEDYYFELWPIQELIALNDAYQVAEFAPQFFLFGSSGGGVALAIEKTTGSIFVIPFVPMSNDEARFFASNMDELFERCGE